MQPGLATHDSSTDMRGVSRAQGHGALVGNHAHRSIQTVGVIGRLTCAACASSSSLLREEGQTKALTDPASPDNQ